MLPHFRRFFRYIRAFHLHPRDSSLRIGRLRLRFLLIFYTVFIPYQLFTRLCLLMDHLFFPGFRRQKVEKPLFIIGNFRSGTTYLHRLLAEDAQFSAMKTWEIYLAPSILQRRVITALAGLDKRCGGWLAGLARRIDRHLFSGIPLHKISFFEPEEDEGLLLPGWDTLFSWWFYPEDPQIRRYFDFDRALPRGERRRIMNFYRACLRRHLYSHGGGRIYLAKNPCATPKIASFLETFPDARFIYLYREPQQTVASILSWFSVTWGLFCDLPDPHPNPEAVLEMVERWYTTPFEEFEQLERDRFLPIPLEALKHEPQEIVRTLYHALGIELPPAMRSRLQQESRRSGIHRGALHTSLQEAGLDAEGIESRLGRVFSVTDAKARSYLHTARRAREKACIEELPC